MPRLRKLPPGMWRRGGAYYARFRAGGREVRKRLSTDFRAACELLNDLRARADKEEFGILDNDYSWAELRKEFLDWARQSVVDWKKYEADLHKFEEFVRVSSARGIDHRLVIAFRAWRLEQGVCPRTINRQVGTLHNMLAKGVEWRRIGSNPLVGLKPLVHDMPTKQRRTLTVEEAQRVFDASSADLLPVWRFYLTSGLRRNEVVKLRFRDIDFERKLIRVVAPKNHKPREVPLDDETYAVLVHLHDQAKHRRPVPGTSPKQTAQQLANFSREHVFVSRANTPRKNNLLRSFYASCKRAGIEGAHSGGEVDIQSLRVSFITLAIENGANPKAVQKIVGHSSLEMTMNVYAKATDASMRDAITALPFATVTPPHHVVPLRNAHKMRTTIRASTERKVAT